MTQTRVRAQNDPTKRGTIVRYGLPEGQVLVMWDGDPKCYPVRLGGVYVQGQDV